MDPAEPHFNLNKGNYHLMNARLFSTDWAPGTELETEAMYNVIKDTLLSLVSTCIPLAKPRSTSNSLCVNQEAMQLKKHKHSMWFQYVRTRDLLDYARFTRARNKLRTLTRNLRAGFEKRLISDIRENHKGFWRYTGSRLRTKTKI